MSPRLLLSRLAVTLAAAAVVLAVGCGEEDPRFAKLEGLAREGYLVYKRECKVCHSMNASTDGPLGPPIAGASIELLEARVLRLQYPPGYTPKRATRAMFPALPHLAPKIPALHAFLDPALHPKPE